MKCTCLRITDTVSLKPSHNYYYQVQFTIFCAKAKWCDFHLCALVDTFRAVLYNKVSSFQAQRNLFLFNSTRADWPTWFHMRSEGLDFWWMHHVETFTSSFCIAYIVFCYVYNGLLYCIVHFQLPAQMCLIFVVQFVPIITLTFV